MAYATVICGNHGARMQSSFKRGTIAVGIVFISETCATKTVDFGYFSGLSFDQVELICLVGFNTKSWISKFPVVDIQRRFRSSRRR